MYCIRLTNAFGNIQLYKNHIYWTYMSRPHNHKGTLEIKYRNLSVVIIYRHKLLIAISASVYYAVISPYSTVREETLCGVCIKIWINSRILKSCILCLGLQHAGDMLTNRTEHKWKYKTCTLSQYNIYISYTCHM